MEPARGFPLALFPELFGWLPVTLAALRAALLAHHSFAAEFDDKQPPHNGFGSKVTYADGRNVFTATPLDRQSSTPPAK